MPSARASFVLVTSPRVADGAEKKRLAEAYGAALVDMEAAAVARLAGYARYSVLLLQGRERRILRGFARFQPLYFAGRAVPDWRRLLFFVLPRPWHWPALIRMGENSKKASQSIAESLLDFLDE